MIHDKIKKHIQTALKGHGGYFSGQFYGQIGKKI